MRRASDFAIYLRRLSLATIGALLMMALAAGSSSAQRSGNAERACTPDAMRLCSEFIPDAQKITECLSKNRRALSPECRSVFSGGGGKSSRRHDRHHRRRR
jgi:hypothetical protein